MTAAAVVALISEVVANLPAAITTGQQVIRLVNDGYKQLSEGSHSAIDRFGNLVSFST